MLGARKLAPRADAGSVSNVGECWQPDAGKRHTGSGRSRRPVRQKRHPAPLKSRISSCCKPTLLENKSMRLSRSLSFAAVALLLTWLAFVATQYTRYRLRMRSVARELQMEFRTFQVVPGSLNPSTAVDGEERLLVVGESADNFLLCSIVRNPR